MLRDKKSVTNRKKYQREVNKIVRKWNQSIKDDWLWDGRFVLRQYAAYFWPLKIRVVQNLVFGWNLLIPRRARQRLRILITMILIGISVNG